MHILTWVGIMFVKFYTCFWLPLPIKLNVMIELKYSVMSVALLTSPNPQHSNSIFSIVTHLLTFVSAVCTI